MQLPPGPQLDETEGGKCSEVLRGLSLLGLRSRIEGFLEHLKMFALSAPPARPEACCLSKLGHCQVFWLSAEFPFNFHHHVH